MFTTHPKGEGKGLEARLFLGHLSATTGLENSRGAGQEQRWREQKRLSALQGPR